MPVLAENKKARFNYEVLESFEAGIVLKGQEVKSIKSGGIALAGSYVVARGGEIWFVGANIPPYQPKNTTANYDPQRPRKLLLKKEEIKYLFGRSQQRGLTLVPLRLYTKQGRIKLEFGIARHKKKFGKKQTIQKRQTQREIERELKTRG